MINLTNLASSLARVALSDSTKPTIDRAMNVVSHIAGKVALQVNSSLLEQKGRLNERQQKGLEVILDALLGKEPVTHVETYEGEADSIWRELPSTWPALSGSATSRCAT